MKKWAVGCGVLAALGFLCVVALALFLFRELPVLDASLSVPAVVARDSELTMVVTATNSEDSAIVLDSIDIADSFLEGFRVIDIQPEPEDTMHVFGMRSWFFEKSVSPGDSLEIEFTLQAVQEGHFSGDVDVCNPTMDYTTVIADVTVRNDSGRD